MQQEKFLTDIQSSDKDVRFAAWRAAGEQDVAVIAPLGGLMTTAEPGVAKAAREGLTTMVHAHGKDPADPKRERIIQQMIPLLAADKPLALRTLVCRLLSGIAGEKEVPELARLLAQGDIREEAIYCIERIPGTGPDKALATAYRTVKDDFKPRILAALGHRRSSEGVALCLEAMRSTNADLSAAAARAFGRIGRKSATPVAWPKAAEPDSILRYADGLRDSGNAAEAVRIYKTMLVRPEEHLQCAAIVGLAKMRTAEAAAAIHPLLKSSHNRVRLTAANAWKDMA